MKTCLLLLLSCISFFSYSQASGERDPQYQIDYEMELSQPGSSIMISTYKSPSEQDKTLVLMTSSPSCDALKGVRIRLANGEMLLYGHIETECGPYAPGRANARARIAMTPELESSLDGQEIVEFTLGNIKTPVKFKEPSENLQALLKWVRGERGF